jgi:hypothetical protein
MSAILDRWTNRLVNWALWEVSGSSRSVGIANYDGRWWDAPPRQTIALVGDAYDVDRLLHRLYRLDLTGKLQYEAVRIHYLWTGSEDMKAHQSGIPERTLRDRVFIAKYRLDDLEQRAKREITRCVSANFGVYTASLPMLSG